MNRLLSFCFLALITCAPVAAQQAPPPAPTARPAARKARVPSAGELAFTANCSRCHTAPEQLPRRVTGTVLMHMRVRANLSAADQKALLHFLAP